MKHYSPSTKGFYDKEVHTVIPEDCVEITDEYWKELQGVEIDFDGEKPIKKVYSNEDLDNQKLEVKIADAKAYLSSTDYKFTADYDKDTAEVKAKRAEARAIIRALENA